MTKISPPDESIYDGADLLPEHRDNPFIVSLGPYRSIGEVSKRLRRRPACSPADRLLPPHVRRQCVMRLLDYNYPLFRQIQLAEQIMMIIRNGYIGRNPSLGLHRDAILDAADRTKFKQPDMASSRGVVSSADGFTILGHPGMGKTKTIEKILTAIPQLVRPKVADTILQVPWLKVEAPSRATRKQFCISFFQALGQRVGVDYYALYTNRKQTPDEMMAFVQQLAHVHALGVLVVDEVQHLNRSPEGIDALMSFLVTLVNTIGVPVVLIGTMGACPVVARDFREARRSSGLGQPPPWQRLAADDREWTALIKDMWQYQWTATVTEYSRELADALYFECQGIIDVAVRIFLCCQMHVIALGELKRGSEEITPELIHYTAEQHFSLVRPIMTALRLKQHDVVAQYPDLTSLHKALDSTFAGVSAEQYWDARERDARTPQLSSDDPLAPVRVILATKGITGEKAEAIIVEALKRTPSGDPFLLVASAAEILRHEPPQEIAPQRPLPKSVVASKAASSRKKSEPSAKVPAEVTPEDPRDLRAIAKRARASGQSVHAALVEAGVVATARAIAAM